MLGRTVRVLCCAAVGLSSGCFGGAAGLDDGQSANGEPSLDPSAGTSNPNPTSGTDPGQTGSSGTDTTSTQPEPSLQPVDSTLPADGVPRRPPPDMPPPDPGMEQQIVLDQAPILCDQDCANQMDCQMNPDLLPECMDRCMEASLTAADQGGACAFAADQFLHCGADVSCDLSQCRFWFGTMVEGCGVAAPFPFDFQVEPPPPPPPMEGVFCAVSSSGATDATACDQQWVDCSDGQSYRSTCIEGASGLACSCIVNGQVQGSFFDASCPLSADQVNAGCGWLLAP